MPTSIDGAGLIVLDHSTALSFQISKNHFHKKALKRGCLEEVNKHQW
jgi:hypothetical protein